MVRAISTIVFMISMSFTFLHADVIRPSDRLQASGMVYDLLVDDGMLYAATDAGQVDVFDVVTKQKVKTIDIPDIKDFMGDAVAPKIYSVDVMDGSVLMVSTGKSGYRNVYVHDGKSLRKIIGLEQKLTVKEARYIDKETILLGLMSNELVLYKTESGSQVYKVQMSPSHFDDLALDEAKTKVATADESGDVYIVDVATGAPIKRLHGQNVDNIYKIDYKNGVIITAGQDRRCAVYREGRSGYHLQGSFLIYAAGLSPSGRIGLFSADIENDIQVFDTKTKRKIAMLQGHDATLTAFAFLDETTLFSSAEEDEILFWRLR